MIPAAAVEAAAAAIERSMFGPVKLGDLARAVLDAAAKHMHPAPATTGHFTQMVDAVLAHDGTQRATLFEYPHRDDDSRAMILEAERLVQEILRLATNEGGSNE